MLTMCVECQLRGDHACCVTPPQGLRPRGNFGCPTSMQGYRCDDALLHCYSENTLALPFSEHPNSGSSCTHPAEGQQLARHLHVAVS